MINSPSTVLFDLDGTLLDTADDLAYCLNLLLIEESRAPLSPDAIRLHVSNGANAMLDFGFGPMEKEYQLHLRSRLLTLYEKNIARHTQWFEGLDRFTELLELMGIPWGIVTNKPRLYTDLLLDAMSITNKAKVVVCPDDLGIAKPDPRPLLFACKQIKADPAHGVYIGDHLRDIEAGKAAGMKTIAAAYGYISPESKIEDWGADYIAHHGLDFPALFAFNK